MSETCNINKNDNQMTNVDNKIDILQYLEENQHKISLIGERMEELIDENGNKIMVLCKYFKEKPSFYNELTKNSIQKYQKKNREKLTDYHKNYIKERYKNDPEFRNKERERKKIYNERKKEKLLNQESEK